MSESTMLWAEVLEDRFGVRLPEEKAHRWERILNAEPAAGGFDAHANNAELAAALTWAAGRKDAKLPERGWTVDVVVRLLRWYRRERSIERTGYSADDTRPEARLARVKAKMRQAGTHAERWDMLCEELDLAGCQAADAWAETVWPVTGAIRARIALQLRADVARIGHPEAMKEFESRRV